jgi:hypothetical protein
MNESLSHIEYYNLPKNELIKLISEGVSIGFQKGLEFSGKKSKYISQNQAHKLFVKSRVQNWVQDGMIKGKPNGNGKTSTIFYELSKLMELDASEKIKIRKPYIKNN